MADRETVPPEPAHKVLLENTLIFHTRNGQSREADWQDFIYPNDPHAIVEIRETNLESENRVRQQVFVKFSQPNIAEKYQIGHIYFVAKSPFKCEQAMITTSLLINLSALTHIKPPLTVTAFRSILADLLQPTNIRTYSIVEMQHSLRILFPTRPEAKKVRDILINSHLFSPPSSFSPSTSIFSATDHFDQTVSITEQSKLKFIRWPNDFDNNHTFLFLSFKSKFIERVKYAQPNETEENIITQFKAWLITELEKLTEQVHRQLEEEHPDRRWKLPSLRIELNCENRVYLPGGHCFFRDVPLEEQEEYTRRVFNLLVKNHPSPAHREPHPAGSLVTNQFGGRTEVAVFINGGKDSDRKVKRNKIDARRRDIQKRKSSQSDDPTSVLNHSAGKNSSPSEQIRYTNIINPQTHPQDARLQHPSLQTQTHHPIFQSPPQSPSPTLHFSNSQYHFSQFSNRHIPLRSDPPPPSVFSPPQYQPYNVLSVSAENGVPSIHSNHALANQSTFQPISLQFNSPIWVSNPTSFANTTSFANPTLTQVPRHSVILPIQSEQRRASWSQSKPFVPNMSPFLKQQPQSTPSSPFSHHNTHPIQHHVQQEHDMSSDVRYPSPMIDFAEEVDLSDDGGVFDDNLGSIDGFHESNMDETDFDKHFSGEVGWDDSDYEWQEGDGDGTRTRE